MLQYLHDLLKKDICTLVLYRFTSKSSSTPSRRVARTECFKLVNDIRLIVRPVDNVCATLHPFLLFFLHVNAPSAANGQYPCTWTVQIISPDFAIFLLSRSQVLGVQLRARISSHRTRGHLRLVENSVLSFEPEPPLMSTTAVEATACELISL
jgi:hypothetical protein